MKITHVAVKYRGKIYSLPSPNRHHHVIWKIAEENGLTPDNPPTGIYGKNQGFLDEEGNYLTRKQAHKIALESGQALPSAKIRDELFSEDLW